MRLRCMFVIEEGPAALKQVVACVGFAEQLGVKISMSPEDEPRKDRVRWNNESAKQIDGKMQKLVEECLRGFGGTALRKEFVTALAVKLRKKPREAGKMVATWIREGVLEEV